MAQNRAAQECAALFVLQFLVNMHQLACQCHSAFSWLPLASLTFANNAFKIHKATDGRHAHCTGQVHCVHLSHRVHKALGSVPALKSWYTSTGLAFVTQQQSLQSSTHFLHLFNILHLVLSCYKS